ncbi:MAG: hypothetical protein ACRCZO_13030 [Cetobacterium sp.]
MSKKSGIYIYFTEGETEEKIISVLKKENLIFPGKINTLNLLQKRITNARIRDISNGTTILIVFDTDIQDQTKIIQLNENISILSKVKEVKNIILIPQNKNLEDELIYATTVTSIKELFDSKSNSDFKRDLKACSNIFQKLESKNFNNKVFWRKPLNPDCKFEQYINNLTCSKVKRY